MVAFWWILVCGVVGFLVVKVRADQKDELRRQYRDDRSDLLAENEELVSDEDYWEAEEPDEYEDEEFIEEEPYGYADLYSDEPEQSGWDDTYDSYQDSDEYRREISDDERW